MIRKLRKRHTILWVVVILVITAGIVISPNEIIYELNKSLPGVTQNFDNLSLIDNATIEWDDLDANGKVYRSDANELILEIRSSEYINKPDILLYLNRIGGKKLTDDSILLGSYQQNNKQLWVLPDSSFTNGSVFILYSLPKREVVATADVIVSGGAE